MNSNSRASKTTLLRQRPQFARQRSYRKSEFARRFITGVPLNAAQKEKTGRRALRSIRERRVVFQITENRRQQPAEIFVNKILAQAKPRFCAGAPNLRGSARAGKVKAVRVLQWCAPKSAPPRKTPAAPRCKRGQRGCPQISTICFVSSKKFS